MNKCIQDIMHCRDSNLGKQLFLRKRLYLLPTFSLYNPSIAALYNGIPTLILNIFKNLSRISYLKN
jgi:hypothetical protein